MSYLERWWRDANETMKADMKALVHSGQLEIVGGGWVMNDEVGSGLSRVHGYQGCRVEGCRAVILLTAVHQNNSNDVGAALHAALNDGGVGGDVR